jgi:hypothetical protein
LSYTLLVLQAALVLLFAWEAVGSITSLWAAVAPPRFSYMTAVRVRWTPLHGLSPPL